MTTEKQYLEYLIKQYQNLIYSICLKSVGNPFDAEDLTQEVFLSAYKNLSRFDGNYEKAWLSKIAVRNLGKVGVFCWNTSPPGCFQIIQTLSDSDLT